MTADLVQMEADPTAIDYESLALRGLEHYAALYPCAPALENRIMVQRKMLQRVFENGFEQWGLFNEGVTNRFLTPPNTLEGSEATLCEALAMSVERRSEKNEARAVVAVDFGGMYSYSFLKIAERLAADIKKGRLIIVSTSFGFDPYSYAPSQEMLRFHDQELLPLFRKVGHLVHYVHCNAFTFRDVSVPTPAGPVFRMGDGVDLIHERASLSLNSKLVDIEFPALGESLAAGGKLLLESEKVENLKPERKQGIDNLKAVNVHLSSLGSKLKYEGYEVYEKC